MIENIQVTPAMVKEATSRLKSGSENDVSIFEHDGKQFVIKEFHGENSKFPKHYPPQELAGYLNTIYQIARKYLPDLVTTLYFVAANGQGTESIFTLQPFVKGKGIQDNRELSKLNLKWGLRVMKDPTWENIPLDLKRYFAISDFLSSNVIGTEDKKKAIIDW